MPNNTNGFFNFSVEWCDGNTGFNQFNSSINITSAFLIMGPAQGNLTSQQPLACKGNSDNSTNSNTTNSNTTNSNSTTPMANSTCLINIPQGLNLTSGQSQNFRIQIPQCIQSINGYNLTWTASQGINVSARPDSNNAIVVQLDTAPNASGSLNFFMEWCDNTGYGSLQSVVVVTAPQNNTGNNGTGGTGPNGNLPTTMPPGAGTGPNGNLPTTQPPAPNGNGGTGPNGNLPTTMPPGAGTGPNGNLPTTQAPPPGWTGPNGNLPAPGSGSGTGPNGNLPTTMPPGAGTGPNGNLPTTQPPARRRR
jgi:hypothetical protein